MKMEQPILITWLNDFIFCPASIYFHNLYEEKIDLSFQNVSQLNGTAAHATIDQGRYSTASHILSGISVYCEKYELIGKIDVFDETAGLLRERKKKIQKIYDGYVFQLYGQYFALKEMGYNVKKLALHSIEDNKTYPIELPEEAPERLALFESTIDQLRHFDLSSFNQTCFEKCKNCIYEPLCDRSLL